MKKHSIKKNFLFQFFYQFLILVIPLIMSPYLTRVVGSTGLGIYTYSNSIAYYFVILAMLGINRYGQRVIASSSDDEEKLRKSFWGLFTVHIIFSIIAIVAYFLFVTLLIDSDKLIYYLQILYVCSAMFDLTWLFHGLENFKSVVIKNAVLKIVECVLIFTLVKDASDLWVYTLICSLGLLLGQAVLLPQAIKLVKPIKISKEDLLVHIKPLFVFSITVVAVSLYTVFDKTLLGLLTNKENVAYYEYSNKIISIPKVIIGVIGTVMFPRACKMANQGDIEGQKKYINYSLIATSIIGMGCIFGLLAVADEFAILYYGKSFSECGRIMMIMSPLIFIVGLGDVVRTQYLIPQKKDKQFISCIVLNAIINLIISVLLIPHLGVYGAVIGTICAELFGCVYQLIMSRKAVNLKMLLKTTVPYAVIGMIMFIFIKLVGMILGDSLSTLLIQIIFGGGLFVVLSFVYVYLFEKDIREKILVVLHKPFKSKEQIVKVEQIRGKRNFIIDIMRVVGVFLIILAHIPSLPIEVKNKRIFDVVMMVFISGMSFSYSKDMNCLYDYIKYVWGRIKKLLFVCWIYLIIYIGELYLLNVISGSGYNVSLKNVVASFVLYQGVGYVWIIRIFLCMALIAPILKFINKKVNSDFIFDIIVAFLIIINACIISFVNRYSGVVIDVTNTVIIPIFSYGIIYLIGIRWLKLGRRNKLWLLGILSIIFVICCQKYGFYDITRQKYPPNILYISYGLMISMALYLILDFMKIAEKEQKIIKWLSCNSMNIYFNHIFIIAILEVYMFSYNAILLYAISISFSVLMTILINFMTVNIKKLYNK